MSDARALQTSPPPSFCSWIWYFAVVTSTRSQPRELGRSSRRGRATCSTRTPDLSSTRREWQSFRVGTTPVGVVVVAPDGTLVAAGPSAIASPPRLRQLVNSHIADAETNALARLDIGRHSEDHRLVTTPRNHLVTGEFLELVDLLFGLIGLCWLEPACQSTPKHFLVVSYPPAYTGGLRASTNSSGRLNILLGIQRLLPAWHLVREPAGPARLPGSRPVPTKRRRRKECFRGRATRRQRERAQPRCR